MEGWPGLSWPGWLVTYWDRFSHTGSSTPDTVTHPSANWSWHRLNARGSKAFYSGYVWKLVVVNTSLADLIFVSPNVTTLPLQEVNLSILQYWVLWGWCNGIIIIIYGLYSPWHLCLYRKHSHSVSRESSRDRRRSESKESSRRSRHRDDSEENRHHSSSSRKRKHSRSRYKTI